MFFAMIFSPSKKLDKMFKNVLSSRVTPLSQFVLRRLPKLIMEQENLNINRPLNSILFNNSNFLGTQNPRYSEDRIVRHSIRILQKKEDIISSTFLELQHFSTPAESIENGQFVKQASPQVKKKILPPLHNQNGTKMFPWTLISDNLFKRVKPGVNLNLILFISIHRIRFESSYQYHNLEFAAIKTSNIFRLVFEMRLLKVNFILLTFLLVFKQDQCHSQEDQHELLVKNKNEEGKEG